MREEEINKLYDNRTVEIMRTTENAYERGSNRVQEIRNFARKSNIKRIGIANCISFTKETEAVKQFLSTEFEVISIDCKCGKVTRQEILGDEGNSIMCNPAGQAEYLREFNTELNISMGLCVGHDMVFNYKSSVPVTTLIVKDWVNKHNILESIKSISKTL